LIGITAGETAAFVAGAPGTNPNGAIHIAFTSDGQGASGIHSHKHLGSSLVDSSTILNFGFGLANAGMVAGDDGAEDVLVGAYKPAYSTEGLSYPPVHGNPYLMYLVDIETDGSAKIRGSISRTSILPDLPSNVDRYEPNEYSTLRKANPGAGERFTYLLGLPNVLGLGQVNESFVVIIDSDLIGESSNETTSIVAESDGVQVIPLAGDMFNGLGQIVISSLQSIGDIKGFGYSSVICGFVDYAGFTIAILHIHEVSPAAGSAPAHLAVKEVVTITAESPGLQNALPSAAFGGISPPFDSIGDINADGVSDISTGFMTMASEAQGYTLFATISTEGGVSGGFLVKTHTNITNRPLITVPVGDIDGDGLFDFVSNTVIGGL